MTSISGKRVLVAGASGFIGGTLTRHLVKQGAIVRAVVRSTSSVVGLSRPGVEVVVAELGDGATMTELARGCDVVVNAAGIVSGSLQQQRAINVDAARTLVTAAIVAGASRLVHISSAGIYGFETPGDVDETASIDPGNLPYGVTKAEGERVVRELASTSNLELAIIRPALVYGPGSAVWTKVMFTWARRRPTIFLGDGSGFAPIVHVDDVVAMISLLACDERAPGEVFNCASDPVPTWREFLSGYAALAGHHRWLGVPVVPVRGVARLISRLAPTGSPPAELLSLIGFLTGRRRFVVDKAERLLGWRPQVGLTAGIASCVPYLREQGLLAIDERIA